jgi:hypothetical protein
MRAAYKLFKSALTLLVIGIFRAYDHNLAVSFDDLAFVAHRFYGRTYFHCFSPLGGFAHS